ncbi:hypothetical protein THAOC_27021 [Thalassiosira oceanica]|uniref:Uncharacterized protein n=1 Tax=Thalassiosira oceanica TaxID=159749 RepID=K0S3R0_THAOC|nr:hypothetical protein THAOC_27021 [Thalassiosira oceanica]|eukprot:EJK53527.1 hypothetical protein THAOC_27021 [Thalassiosira oceanica]
MKVKGERAEKLDRGEAPKEALKEKKKKKENASASAFFEVKTCQANPSNYSECIDAENQADRRRARVRAWSQYKCKFERLDKTFAQDAPGFGQPGFLGPFSQAQNFWRQGGGAFPIMHRQFRQAVGVMATTGNAALKLSTIHYLHSTKREAAYAANTNRSKYRSLNSHQRGASWYQRHAHEGYGAFQQFQNG